MEYSLKSGAASGVVSTQGGELISYRDASGTEYVWTGDPAYWHGRAPVLFPVIGALRNGSVRIGGKEYRMPRHGVARQREFSLADLKEDSATFEFRSDEETRAMFPYEFSLRVTHRIGGRGFSTAYDVSSPDGDFCFCIGGHAGFRCPLHPGESFSDYEIEFEKEERLDSLLTDPKGILHGRRRPVPLAGKILPLGYDLFDGDVLIFDDVNSRALSLRDRRTGSGLEFRFDGFSNLGIWTPPGKRAPFLCLEPWQGLPAFSDEDGSFEHKPGLIRCKPGVPVRKSYRMTVL